MGKLIDLTGSQFGCWKVLKMTDHKTKYGGIKWLCKCMNCGSIKEVEGASLRSGDSTNCGCIRNLKSKDIIYNIRKKYNKYNFSGDIGIGITGEGEQFIFDLDDYDKIKNFCWSVNDNGYVKANNKKGASPRSVKLHRLIMGVTDPKVFVDHINHDKLDNRKCNLRLCSRSQNMMNLRPKPEKQLPKGVTLEHGKYVAKITENTNVHNLGHFDNLEDALKARKAAEEKYYGEFKYDKEQDYRFRDDKSEVSYG